MSLAGHSDADVGLHALTDAVLGAIGAGDIGMHFPPSDPRWRGAASDRFLRHAADLVRVRGGAVAAVDVTIICERPKIGPHRAAMIERVADILGIAPVGSASRRRQPKSSALPAVAKASPRKPSPPCACLSDPGCEAPSHRRAAMASGGRSRHLVWRRLAAGHAGNLGISCGTALRMGDPRIVGHSRAGGRHRARLGHWLVGRRTVARASAAADPAEIVIDEVAGQWLALLATPLAPLPYAAGFVIFRIFDIWKPWPVSWADRNVKGGLGIMLDDLLAAVYAFFVLAVISGVFGVWG